VEEHHHNHVEYRFVYLEFLTTKNVRVYEQLAAADADRLNPVYAEVLQANQANNYDTLDTHKVILHCQYLNREIEEELHSEYLLLRHHLFSFVQENHHP
jgi:hypothetical protein